MANALVEVHNQILRGVYIPVGNTVVQAVSILDDTHFAIEQRISICFQPPHSGKGWTVLIWTDGGSKDGVDSTEKSLASALGVVPSLEDSLLPVINYKPMMGLNAHSITKNPSSCSSGPPPKILAPQFDYGRTLRQNLMAHDPFYALTEIFGFAASSEKQFLNPVEIKLEKIDPDCKQRNNLELHTLRHLDKVLFRHVRHIQSTIAAIENSRHPKWPRSDDDAAKRAREAIERDFQDLYEHATAVYKRCQEKITVLMNTIVILESEKAMNQSERIRKLTFLAFIFAPLSFTTSFFGMNVQGLQAVSIWSWCLMTSVVLILAICFMFLDVQQQWNQLKAKASRIRR